jgi:hypothetical protein
MSNPELLGESATSFEAGDIPHVLSQIARLGEAVKAEFDLIAGRMSWLVIAESFFFSAFVTAATNYRPEHWLAPELRYMIWALPFVGIFLAASVYIALLAALSSINTLKRQRDGMMKGLPSQLRIDLISSRSRQQRWGDLATHVIPPVLVLVWAGAIAFLLISLRFRL